MTDKKQETEQQPDAPSPEARQAAEDLARQGHAKAMAGEWEAAQALFEQHLEAVEALGDAHAAAAAMGAIAGIRATQGELDVALDMHRRQRQRFIDLGDARGAAMAQGHVAHILLAQGKPDEARQQQEERLKTNHELGDPDGIASTQWDLAQMDLERGDRDSAMPRLAEAWGHFGTIQRKEGLAPVGTVYGQLLLSLGEQDQAREVLTRARACWAEMGNQDHAERIDEIVLQHCGPPKEDPIQQAIDAVNEGRPEEALQGLTILATRAVGMRDPGLEATARGYRAQVLAQLGRWEEACNDARRALAIAERAEQPKASEHFRQLLQQLEAASTTH